MRRNLEALIRRATRTPWDPAMLVAVGTMLLVVALWLARAPGPSARASLADVDTAAVDAPLAELRSRWEAEFAALRDRVRELAVDDATYEFARRPNFPYVEDHFGPRRLAELDVDTILITNAEGRPVFWRRPNDPDNRGFPDAEAFLASLPPLPPAARRKARGEPVLEGIAQFRGEPALVSAIAIEPARGDGSPRGYLIYGRELDGAVSKRVMDGLPAGIDVMPARDPLLAPEVRIRLEQPLAPVVVADAKRVRGYLPLLDLQGQLLRVYAAAAPRAPSAAAPTAEAAEVAPTSSWLVVVGATLLLLAIGGGGLWWAFMPARRLPVPNGERSASSAGQKSPLARVAPVGAIERTTATPGAPAAAAAVGPPRAPLERLAQALAARSHRIPEEPHPAYALMGAELRDEERGERDRGTEDTVTEALARLSADPGPDDHEWLIGTPDEIIVGEPLEEVPLADESPRDDTRDGTRDDTHDDRHATGFEGDELDEAAFEAPPFDERGEDEGSPAPASSRLARDLPLAADLRTVPLVPPSAASAPLQASGVDFGAPAPARTLAASPRVTDAPALVLASRAREAVVRGLLEAGHLRVHYQPQVTPGTRQVIGVEALVRWQDEEAALRAATDLFGDGTSADAFAGATEFVLHTACADRRSWLRQVGRSWPVAVNVGLAELREPGFFDRVLRVLEANELPPAYLELEVPERALAQLGTPECEALDRAYRHGLAVAVGGFVAADAPLRVLSQVPISKLKIHRALVADLPDCAHARMVVDSILAIGRTLGVTVCAEGVETAAQAGYLDMMQCPAGQGWYYSRALDAEQLLQLVRGSGVDTVTLPLMDVEELEAHARAAGVV